MSFTYCIFTFDGDLLPIAKKLQDEGNEVYVCQIKDGSALGASWVADKEDYEVKKRRMSLYDGYFKKYSLEMMMMALRRVKDKDQYFIIFGHNSLYTISEKVLKMGFTKGLFPTEEDFNREADRKKSKQFVKKYYPDVNLAETKEFKSVDDVISFIQESDKFWVVKSDGNFGETLVPDKDDLEMSKQQIISQLTAQKSAYEKGSMILEEKIMDIIEFAPQMVFWNGEYVYSEVEIETRMFGSGDIGEQTGGNQNVVIGTKENCKANEMFFPEEMRAIAKKHKGMFICDAGILSDGKDYYFTEFAGNRWGWGGIFSEMSASEEEGKLCTNYFESVAKGENPYRYKFGTSLAVYNLKPDPKFAGLPKGDIIMQADNYNFFPMQCKLQKVNGKEEMMNVGYREFGDCPLGYVVSRGDTLESAVKPLYKTLNKISFKGLYYRPYSDWFDESYTSSVINRYNFLKEKDLL